MQALYQLSYSPASVGVSPDDVKKHSRSVDRKRNRPDARPTRGTAPPVAAERHRRTTATGGRGPPPGNRHGRLGVVAEHRLREGAGIVLGQPPAARALAEDRPAAVGQPAQRLPGERVEAEQPADGRTDRAAVADHDQHAAVGQFVRGGQHHGSGPVGDLGLQFAAAPADRLTALPGGVLLAELAEDLLVGQPLPAPGVRLLEALVVRDGQAGERGQLGGGRGGPAQVRGDDGVGRQRGQQPGGAAGLGDTGVGQLDIGVALEALLQIPAGLAVPPQDDPAAPAARLPVQLSSPSSSAAAVAAACALPLPRVATASSGRAISGQSFHSRSRA